MSAAGRAFMAKVSPEALSRVRQRLATAHDRILAARIEQTNKIIQRGFRVFWQLPTQRRFH